MDSKIIKVSDEDGLSQDYKNSLAHFDSMTVYKEGKHEVPMLWQEEKRSFPKNWNVALNRLNMLEQQLKRDLDLRKKYEDTICTYIENSYASKLRREKACSVGKDMVSTTPSYVW